MIETMEEAEEIFHAMGGRNNERYWALHLEEARRQGREGANGMTVDDLFIHCVWVASRQYLEEDRLNNLDAEYNEIMSCSLSGK